MQKNFLLFIALLAAVCTQGQPGRDVPLDAPQTISFSHKTDSIINMHMAANQVVGLSIGVVWKDGIILSRGYGTMEVDKDRPVDSLTNFLTCSVSKLFTATAVMQLVEEGKMELQKKVVDYLPRFKMKDERYKDITIEHLLTHTSGLYWDERLRNAPNDTSALRKFVYSLDNKVLDFAPGTRFDATQTYSNVAYDILGYLVEDISGMPYEEYIRQHIFNKTDMPNSAFNYAVIDPARRAAPHVLKRKKPAVGGVLDEGREHSPCGNLNSCSVDLCNWMIHILNVYNDREQSFNGVLKQRTLLNMWTPRQVAPQNPRVTMGLGWFMKDSEDLGKYCWHVGDNPGFSSTLMVFPENDFGITILTNGMYAEDVIWNQLPFEVIGLIKESWKR